MATEDGPEASLSDALERERNAKLAAFVRRRGLVVATLACEAVRLGAIVRAVGVSLGELWRERAVEREFVGDLVLSTVVTIVFAGALRVTSAAMLAVGPPGARMVVAAVTVLQWGSFVLVVGFQVARFGRALVSTW